MAEWRIDGAGVGGSASPPQFWDLDTGVVRVGARRSTLSVDDADYDLLRAARDASGRPFPATFKFSPAGGAALTPPPAPGAITVPPGGPPVAAWSAAALFRRDPEPTTPPGDQVAYAGAPAMSLVCDLPRGLAHRWSEAAGDWRPIGSIPAEAGPPARQRPAATTQGFAYAGLERATAVSWPGPDVWQEVSQSPLGVRPLTAMAPLCEGAAAVAAKDGAPQLLAWTPSDGWSVSPLAGAAEAWLAELSPLVSDGEAIVGAAGFGLFRIEAGGRLRVGGWPPQFLPNLGVAPVLSAAGDLQLGEASGARAWALFAPGWETSRLVEAGLALTPCRDALLGADGRRAAPEAPVSAPMRTPMGWVGRPLAAFNDGVLFLLVEAGADWADALTLRPRRWSVRLALLSADGSVKELTAPQRWHRSGEVQALLYEGGVCVLGLADGQALLWRRD